LRKRGIFTHPPSFDNEVQYNEHWFRINIDQTAEGAFVVAIKYISEIKALETQLNALKAANNELNEIIELSADGLVSLDHTGVILRMNKAYEKIVGIKAEDYLGNDWPGNVRELENAIERFVVLSDEMFIDSAVLSVEAGGERVLGDDQAGLRNLMESAEK
jgi:transcriptional regulator with PAS, ATPase and Fis domain